MGYLQNWKTECTFSRRHRTVHKSDNGRFLYYQQRAPICGKFWSEELEDLQNRLKELDMESYCEIDLHNRVRLVRAIKLCILTGEIVK